MKKRANIWPFGAGQPLGRRTTYRVTRTRASSPRSALGPSVRESKQREQERMRRKLDDPDLERKLKAHYARGGSLHEFLTANPSARGHFSSNAEIRLYHGHTIWPVPGGWKTSLNSLATFPSERAVKDFIDAWHRLNPAGTEGEFQRCVEAVAAKGGAYDPRAVCAAMERRKYGQAELTRRAKAGKRAAAKKRNRVPDDLRDRAARALDLSRRGGERGNKAAAARERVAAWLDGARQSVSLSDIQFLERISRAAPVSSGLHHPNPASEAAAVYEQFHGRPSTRETAVRARVHHHMHLAELGSLELLVVDGEDGYRHRIVGFDGAILASNEEKNQLFIEGGDQELDAAEFHLEEWPHEKNVVGEVAEIRYFTTKDHLGSDGGTALYFHKAGTTVTAMGRHSKVGYGPQLIYRTRDKSLEFAGGTYEIKAEGIDK